VDDRRKAAGHQRPGGPPAVQLGITLNAGVLVDVADDGLDCSLAIGQDARATPADETVGLALNRQVLVRELFPVATTQ
jgi:hypothetical protein